MAKARAKEEKRVVEPGLFLRVVADQFYTLLFVAAIIVVLVGWVMLDTHNAGRDIPAPLYLYLAIGLGLAAFCGVVRWRYLEELETVWQRRRAAKEAKILLKEVRRGRKRYSYRLTETQQKDLAGAEDDLASARDKKEWDRLGQALKILDEKLDEHLSFARKSTAREYAESIGVAVLIALLLRSFVVEAFRIPSGSMIPTLLVGDHIFVNKFIYGVRVPWTDVKFGMSVRKPERGEVIVFKYPREPDKDFIKRIVGIAGDTVEIKDNVIWINGQPIQHDLINNGPCEYDDKLSEDSDRWEHRSCVAFHEKLGTHDFTAFYDLGGALRSWPAVKVPPDSVFVMGDNRDNSHDSRYWGFVPFELIKGKAMIIWWSSGQPEGIRVKRMGHLVE